MQGDYDHQYNMDSAVEGSRQLGLVLAGGGARAAYQAGVLEYIQELAPETRFPIITGVSAGAINAAYMAGHAQEAGAKGLADCWTSISGADVFVMESALHMVRRILRRVMSDQGTRTGDSLLNPEALRKYLADQLPASEDGSLPRIGDAIKQDALAALCITTTSYDTGQSVSWIQGRDVDGWERSNRIAVKADLTLEHIMASSAIPLLFPAVQLGDAWYGDGSVRLVAPLAPSLHLGATDILVISTRYTRSADEASRSAIRSYPPAAQVMGILLNAIFLDTVDHDAEVLRRMSTLAQKLSGRDRGKIRPVNCLVLRPSLDLGRLASGYEGEARGVMGILARGLGSSETESSDLVSVLLFEPNYIRRLIDLGWEDARRQRTCIESFIANSTSSHTV